MIHEARRTAPSILYIPYMTTLWRDVMTAPLRAAFLSMVQDIPPTAPLLTLAVMERYEGGLEEMDNDADLERIIDSTMKYEMTNPTAREREEFFQPVFEAAKQEPTVVSEAVGAAPEDELPVVPLADVRQLTEKEEKRLRRKEDAKLRELRIFLRYLSTLPWKVDDGCSLQNVPVVAEIYGRKSTESKSSSCLEVPSTQKRWVFGSNPLPGKEEIQYIAFFRQVYDYLEVITTPMDFDQMLSKLDKQEYNSAAGFLQDIDLICDNAIQYNSDVNYETNKIICHRAHGLRDFAYALVKVMQAFSCKLKNIMQRT